MRCLMRPQKLIPHTPMNIEATPRPVHSVLSTQGDREGRQEYSNLQSIAHVLHPLDYRTIFISLSRLLTVSLALPILAMAGEGEIFREDFESYSEGPWGDAAWRFFAVNGAEGEASVAGEAAADGKQGLVLKRSGQVIGDTAFDREGNLVATPEGGGAMGLLFDARGTSDPYAVLQVGVGAGATGLAGMEFGLAVDQFQTCYLPFLSPGGPLNLRFGFYKEDMGAHIDNIRIVELGNRIFNGDFREWKWDAPVGWRVFSLAEGDFFWERDESDGVPGIRIRRARFSWSDAGLDIRARVRVGEQMVLKFQSSKGMGSDNVGLAVAMVLYAKPAGAGDPLLLTSRVVMPQVDIEETQIEIPPIPEDGFLVIFFKPWDEPANRAGVGEFLLRNVKLEARP